MHISILPTIRRFEYLSKDIKRISEQLKQLEETRKDWSNTSNQTGCEAEIKHLESRRKSYNQIHSCSGAALLEEMLENCFEFYSHHGSCWAWLLTLSIVLESTAQVPKIFAMLPEYFINDIADFLQFVIRRQAKLVSQDNMSVISTLLMVIVCSANYLKNPYLVAGYG